MFCVPAGIESYQTEQREFVTWLEDTEDKVRASTQQFDLDTPTEMEVQFEVPVTFHH